jgi:hypothetical protein
MSAMIVPLVPGEGWVVLHLFCKATARADGEAISRAVKAAEEGGQQVVSFAVLGHKADLGFMLIVALKAILFRPGSSWQPPTFR